MNQQEKGRMDFNRYEYKEVTVKGENRSLYLDCYENFGWFADENVPAREKSNQWILNLKRDRKIVNKAELTRLQRHFEACIAEIAALEKLKTRRAALWAGGIGTAGTVCMAGSTFAVTATPPLVWLCGVLAVPGFAGWILPYFMFKRIAAKQKKKLEPLIEAKYEEIYGICQKGHSLL